MKPAFILGIDGLPYTLARRLINHGVMPNLGRLARMGTLAQLHTTVPDFSCVAWTSFATGVNPGKHGIYGFQDFHPSNASLYVPNAIDCKAPPLWHEVGKAGGRSIVLNLPNTYPALPLRGKMASGFIAVDFEKSFYPPAFGQTLKNLGYRMDLDGQLHMIRSDPVRQLLGPVFEARKTAIRHLINNERWDLCIAVITETDRLQHSFLHALDTPEHPDHEWVLRFYQELDAFIGEVSDMLAGKADLYMVSDHGFDVVQKEIILEDILADMGLSVPAKLPAYQNEDTARQTKVFTLDPGRFYINRKGSRFPYGIVEESEATDILAAIRERLLDLKDEETGEPIVNTVRLKDETFSGPTTHYAPDMVAATAPGYYFKSFDFHRAENIQVIDWEGNHVWNDALMYAPHPIVENYQPMIWDVLPTAMASMGINLPNELDGKDIAAPGIRQQKIA
jgi:predicted AlkP superfamily phosphohydrolase/phosphomutase